MARSARKAKERARAPLWPQSPVRSRPDGSTPRRRIREVCPRGFASACSSADRTTRVGVCEVRQLEHGVEIIEIANHLPHHSKVAVGQQSPSFAPLGSVSRVPKAFAGVVGFGLLVAFVSYMPLFLSYIHIHSVGSYIATRCRRNGKTIKRFLTPGI